MWSCPADEPCHALRLGICLLTYAAFLSPLEFFGESYPDFFDTSDLTAPRVVWWVVLFVVGASVIEGIRERISMIRIAASQSAYVVRNPKPDPLGLMSPDSVPETWPNLYHGFYINSDNSPNDVVKRRRNATWDEDRGRPLGAKTECLNFQHSCTALIWLSSR